MCDFFFLPCWIRWTSGERGGRNQRHGHWLSTSARQLCICLHLTPAKSPSGSLPRSSLSITSIPPSFPKGFPSYCRGNSSAPAQWATATVSHLNHTHAPPRRPGRAAANSENWLDSMVIKVIKANWGYWKRGSDKIRGREPCQRVVEKPGWDGFQREKRPIHGGHMCHGSHMTDTAITAFSPHKHQHCIMCFCFSKQHQKIYHHIRRDISVLSLSNWSCFEKASVYTRTDKGKSRFDWVLNNANRHDKNGALKSAFDKHEPGSHQKIAFDTKGFFPHLHLCCSVGGQPLGRVWSGVRLWFREGLGVLAVILWKQTNLGNQSQCLEWVKVPFPLAYQPWVVSLKEFVLYSKYSLGSSVYTSLCCSYCLFYNLFYFLKDMASWGATLFDINCTESV